MKEAALPMQSVISVTRARLISTKSGFNFNLGFFIFWSKVFSRIIFSILFIACNHQVVGEKDVFVFKLSYLNSNFALTLGYLNPALINSALGPVSRKPR